MTSFNLLKNKINNLEITTEYNIRELYSVAVFMYDSINLYITLLKVCGYINVFGGMVDMVYTEKEVILKSIPNNITISDLKQQRK